MAQGIGKDATIGFDSLAALITQNADGMVVLDEDGRTLLINPAAERLLGRSSETMIGEVFGFPVVDGTTTEVDVLRSDRELLVAEMRVASIEWKDRPAYLATLRDVTERKRRQAHLAHTERMASVGTLAAGVAHEVNNPLTYVMFNIQLLEQKLPELASAIERHVDPSALPEPCRPDAVRTLARRAAQATEGAMRIRDIVRTLTSFSRDEPKERSPVEVNTAIESAVQMARNQIRYRARLVRDLRADAHILGNEGSVTQVVLNLLINASQAIPEGHVDQNEIAVRSFVERGKVVIEVCDTGGGIPPALVPRVFEPFFTTKPAGQGSGLGLSICHNIIDGLGGTIELDSAPDAGTRVRVLIPAMVEPAAPTHAEKDRRSEPPETERQPRVLVIDDEPLVAATVEALLEDEFEVFTANSGTSAQRRLQEDPDFDVILSDLLMPDISGMDLYAWLEAEAPALLDRMVFMTGGAFTERARSFLAAMGPRCIEKPIDARALRSLVRRAAKRSGRGNRRG